MHRRHYNIITSVYAAPSDRDILCLSHPYDARSGPSANAQILMPPMQTYLKFYRRHGKHYITFAMSRPLLSIAAIKNRLMRAGRLPANRQPGSRLPANKVKLVQTKLQVTNRTFVLLKPSRDRLTANTRAKTKRKRATEAQLANRRLKDSKRKILMARVAKEVLAMAARPGWLDRLPANSCRRLD